LAGSVVILTLFCSTEAGKCGEGYDVSQRRKEECVVPGAKPSHNLASVGIQLTARWQF
jgi:hypothetical protein